MSRPGRNLPGDSRRITGYTNRGWLGHVGERYCGHAALDRQKAD